MEKLYVLVAIDKAGKAMGCWDGRHVNKKTIQFIDAHDAAVELNNYRPRFIRRYPEECKVVRADLNFSWDALTVETRSARNPKRRQRKATVGRQG